MEMRSTNISPISWYVSPQYRYNHEEWDEEWDEDLDNDEVEQVLP